MQKAILTFFLSISLVAVTSAFASPAPGVANNEIVLDFPESATFRATLTSAAEIRSVVLEYGNEQETCGEVIAKAFPPFTPGQTVEAEWTWEMRQSGSLPPGAQLWWRWRVTDATGQETVSETQTATWLDDVHKWQTIDTGGADSVRLHWYEGDQAFATDLLNAASEGLSFNEEQSGLKAGAPIDIYIYAHTDDLKDAILYEPSWIGGRAFPDQNIVILGISQDDLEWGRETIVHELTHVLVGHLTFSCLGDVPTWLNEGLAMYSEGELDPASQRQLDDAIRENTLLSLRSLSAGFSEDAYKARLSYNQSYSVTKFMIETYGQEQMTNLLLGLRDGLTADEALLQTYGFDVEGLEAAWRQSIGAQPSGSPAQPTLAPTPTWVPTFVPVGSVSAALQVTATPASTSAVGGEPAEAPAGTGPPVALTVILLALCCVFIALAGVVVMGFVIRRQNRQGGHRE